MTRWAKSQTDMQTISYKMHEHETNSIAKKNYHTHTDARKGTGKGAWAVVHVNCLSSKLPSH